MYLFFVFYYFCVIGDINSVGLECYLDRVEVTGSNPVCPTYKNPPIKDYFQILIELSEFQHLVHLEPAELGFLLLTN